MKKDLKFFIVQFKVKKLYRDYMRLIYKSKAYDLRTELVQQVKSEFMLNKNCNNLEKIDYFVATGRHQISQLRTMLDMRS